MTRFRMRVPVALLVIAVAAGACRPAARSSTARQEVTIRPVPLPNLATAAAPLQQMVRERHAAAERAGTSPARDAMRARAWGEYGMVLMAAEYFREAEIALQNAEALAPNEMRWPYYLGHLYRGRGDVAKTTAAFERAVNNDESYAPAFVWLGYAYLDQGRPDAAEPWFSRALMREPRMVTALLGSARAALARGDNTAAISLLERALTIDPDAAAVHFALALAYRGAGQPEKAQAHLRPAGAAQLRPPDPIYEEIELLLETPVAFELRGARAMGQGQYDQAIADFGRGVALDPDEPALRHKLATALALKGDLPRALATMRETVRRSPDFAKGHYSLGLLYLQSNDWRRAAASFEDALQVESTYVEPRLQLAHLLRRVGQSSASLPHYMRLVELDPRIAEARFGYAMALVDVGRFADARDQLAQGVRMFPDQPAFAVARARILAAAPDPAVRDGQQALATMQSLPAGVRNSFDYGVVTAMALAETGQFDQAAELQRQVLEQLPPSVDVRLREGVAEGLRQYQQRRALRRPWAPAEPMELNPGI